MLEIKVNGESPQDEGKKMNMYPQLEDPQIVPDKGESDFMLSSLANPVNGNKVLDPVAGTSSKPPFVEKKFSWIQSLRGVLGFDRDASGCTIREIAVMITLLVLMIGFLVSFAGFIVMWFTNVYNNALYSKLILAKNSTAAGIWMSPPINTYLKVHIYNYTNIQRFLRGLDKKLIVKDLGPYTYKENVTKVNVMFNGNNTISYREHRTYEFIPEMSAGRQYDKVTVPNVPFLSMVSKYHSGHLNGLAFHVASATMPKVFINVAADPFLWGYKDSLIDLSKRFSDLPFENFGMLVTRNGTSRDFFSINTGEDDLRTLGLLSRFNGEKLMNFWSTDECNRVDGSDGSQFPPHLMAKQEKLDVYIQAMCRKLPLIFDSEINFANGVPAYRYKTPLNVFGHPDINPENQCFCAIDAGMCPPTGLFNATLCYDAPIYISFPHFFSGDSSIYSEYLEGIAPEASKHQTFVDIHPRLGFPIDGASRLQINIEHGKDNTEHAGLRHFPAGAVLPVIWLEVTSGNLTDDFRAIIYHSIYSANALEQALRYGTLLSWVTCLAFICVALCRRKPSRGKVFVKK